MLFSFFCCCCSKLKLALNKWLLPLYTAYVFLWPISLLLCTCFLWTVCILQFVYFIWRHVLLTRNPHFHVIFTNFTARCNAEWGYATVCRLSVCLSVCMSVRPSVTFRYRDHVGWNLEYFENNFTAGSLPAGIANIGDLANGNTPKIRVE